MCDTIKVTCPRCSGTGRDPHIRDYFTREFVACTQCEGDLYVYLPMADATDDQLLTATHLAEHEHREGIREQADRLKHLRVLWAERRKRALARITGDNQGVST